MDGYMHCPDCGAWNSKEGLKDRRGACCVCSLILDWSVRKETREVKQCFVNHWLHCPYCNVLNRDEDMKVRGGRCCGPRCKKWIPISNAAIDASIEGGEVMDNIKAMGITMSNNELGQTISTIELLARHRMCTLGLVNLKTELEQELNERRKEEQREREYEQKRLEVKEIMTGWVSRNTIANALVGALSYPGQEMSVESAKNLWIRCLADLNGFVEEHLSYPK